MYSLGNSMYPDCWKLHSSNYVQFTYVLGISGIIS